MKKAIMLAIAFAFVFSFSVPALADDLPRPVKKLVDGTMEIVKSPIVIYDHTKKTYDDADFKPLGLLKGLLESPFHVVKKAGGRSN